MSINKTSILKLLLFIFGFSQFFIAFEPGPSEAGLILLLPFITRKALLHPAAISLFIGNLIAISLEAYHFGGIYWSLISTYLTLYFVVILSGIERLGYDAFKYFITGGALACAATLFILITSSSPDLYRYGIRFTGYFKDPNVTAPTALFFGIAALYLDGKNKLWAIFPLIVFALAISRASYLALFCSLIIVASVGSIFRVYFSIFISFVLIGLSNQLIAVINMLFGAMGRGSIVNSYDYGRSANWKYLIDQWVSKPFPLGPYYSDINGFAAHSTLLRLLVEQGIISLLLFLFACFLAFRATQPRIILLGFLVILVNGVVIDATHWRILFIALAISIGGKHLINKKSTIASSSQKLIDEKPSKVIMQ